MKIKTLRTFLAVYVILILALYLFSLWGRVPDIDDAWIGEHAYWQAKTGHVKSELMRGITDQQDYLIVHHKLLTLQGSLFIKLFGFSLYSLKAVSLVYFILFLVLFFLYTRVIKPLFYGKDLLMAAAIIFSYPWIFKYSFLFRPEIMVMTFTFASFMLTEFFLEKKGSWFLVMLAGILAGLSVTTHLNGIIVVGAGLILLLANKKVIASIWFILGALMGISIYFYDFNSQHGLDFWLYQMRESPSLDSLPNVSLFMQPFYNLFGEHHRFFHNPQIIFFSVFLFFVIITGIRFIWREHRNLTIYTLSLMLLLGMIAVHKSRQYTLVYFPFLVILTTLIMHRIMTNTDDNSLRGWRSMPWARVTSAILLLVFLIGSTYFNVRLSLEKFSPDQNRAISREFVREDPDTLNVIAPMTFIFNEIEYYRRIQGEVCYTELQKENPGIYGEGFFDKAKDFNIDYIFLTPYYLDKLGLSNYKQGDLAGCYVMEGKKGDVYAFRRSR